MKCVNCGKNIEKSNAKFCPHCGNPVKNKSETKRDDSTTNNSSSNKNTNIMIMAITAIIVIVIIAVTAMYLVGPSMGDAGNDTYVSDNSQSSTEEVKSEQVTKSWQSIGHFDGSGSGTKTITVPAGQIRIDLSAYPIKNYATNHLYVSGSNGKSAALDWGPRSAVATHSDSISFTSSSETTFTIDYYETVSWEVSVYKYQ